MTRCYLAQRSTIYCSVLNVRAKNTKYKKGFLKTEQFKRRDNGEGVINGMTQSWVKHRNVSQLVLSVVSPFTSRKWQGIDQLCVNNAKDMR